MPKNKSAPAYSKAQLLSFPRFARWRDLLCVLLDGGRTYSVREAETLIQTFMNGKKGTVK